MIKPYFAGHGHIIERQIAQDADIAWIVYSGTGSPGGPIYTLGVVGSLGNVPWTGIIFKNVSVPKGSTIDSAVVTVMAASAHAEETVNAILGLEDADTVAAFSTWADFAARTITTAHVHFDAVAAWTAHAEYDLPDISACLQEVIDRAGWAPGNDICVLIQDNGSTQTPAAYRSIANYSHDPFGPPRIKITYH